MCDLRGITPVEEVSSLGQQVEATLELHRRASATRVVPASGSRTDEPILDPERPPPAPRSFLGLYGGLLVR